MNKSPKIKLLILLSITLIGLIYIISSSIDVNNRKEKSPTAVKGVIDLRDWDFTEDGLIKLDGQWEFFAGELLTAEDFSNTFLKKNYRTIPGTIGEEGYGTYRLKVLLNSDDFLYSVKIDYLENAFKLWANDKYVVSVGEVGKSKYEMKPQQQPKVGSFYSQNGEVYLILQVSNFYTKYGFIDNIFMGEASEIHRYSEKKQAFELFIFGCSIIATVYNLAVYFRRKKDKAPLYFAIVCLIAAIRTIFLGERFIISLFPDFDYTIGVKIMLWSFYLYIPFVILFINKSYGEVISKKALKFSNILAVIYALLVLISPTKFYVYYIVPFEIYVLWMLSYMMMKISRVYIQLGTSDYITVVGLFALFVTRINDFLYEYSIIITDSFAPVGIIIFIVCSYYTLAEKQADALSKSEELSERLKSLNSLKDDFLAITSHELKTPLSGIIGLSELLAKDSLNGISDDDRYDLFLINSSARRLSNLVDDIIVFSKLKNKEIKLIRKPVKLNKIVEIILKFAEPTIINKNIELVNLIDEAVPYVNGDENRIEQILYNIVGNAIKFTHQGKVIISHTVKEKYLEVSIEDNGIGIPKKDIDKIFNIYEQGDDVSTRYGGTGLGLYITKNLVELHQGEITVSSTVGKGSIFTFTLPLCAEEEILASDYIERLKDDALDAPVNQPAEKSQKNINSDENKKILIVDDEYVNLKLIEDCLSELSQDIFKASTGKSAIEIIEKQKDLDLVILDMMLPDLLGYEICSKIREKYSLFQLPILIMTADTRPENLVLSFQYGANDYLKKPFNKEELLSRAGTLLALKHSVKEALTLVQQVALANEKIDDLSIKNEESAKKVEELVEYDKLKTEFFTNISHELKTPLNVISSTIQLLKSLDKTKKLGDEKIKSYLDIMNQNVFRLLRLINNLIDTTKIDGNYLSLHLVNGNIVYLVEELVQSVAEFVKSKGINLIFDTEVEEKIILFDEEKLERIILNLLSNAVKFTDVGGNIFVNIYNKKDFIEISVKDTGMGIPEDKINFIFERFAQVDRSTTRNHEGSGIGLALVKSLAEMQGGNISVKSELGRGSEFIVRLPVKKSDEVEFYNKEFVKTQYQEKMKIEFSDIYF